MAPALLEMSDVHKRFGPVTALDGVSVRVAAGRVHGLLGENGAGKSTLMNVAYGMLRPDAGRLAVAGADVRFRSPRDAIAAGVGMVHQHFMLAGAMSVLDNVLLGDRRLGTILSRRRAAERLAEMSQRLGLPVDPSARVEQLSVGGQQRVEILKALWRDARALILDEPTAVLTPAEVEQLIAAMAKLRDEGRAVVFISHKLGEVRRICDDLTVLRRGRVVWTGEATAASNADLARHMVGHDVTPVTRKIALGEESSNDAAKRPAYTPAVKQADAVLTLDAVSAGPLRDVSLDLIPGEIVGIAGVDGNGQQEFAEIVVGLTRPTRGRVLLEGRDVTTAGLADRTRAGVAHVPNDRKREGLVATMSVAENIALKAYDRSPVGRHGLISWRSVRRVASDVSREFDIRAASIDVPVGTLSGGNQQKVVLARELALRAPKVIVAMNPVRGLDVAATQFVYEQLLTRRAAGAAILLISSELDELLALCDRLAVLYAGRLTMTDFPRTGRDEIGRLMAGLE